MLTLAQQIEIARKRFIMADASNLKEYEAARLELKRLRDLQKQGTQK
jgi:hypothetical protein